LPKSAISICFETVLEGERIISFEGFNAELKMI
jgi:hypothetical protein